jgi:hypothetical protein
LGVDGFSEFFVGFSEVEFLLEAEPESGGGAEVAAEAEGGIRRDRASAVNEGGDAAVWDFEVDGEAVLGDSKWVEKLGLQNFAGVWKVEGCAGFGHDGTRLGVSDSR